VKRGRHAQPTGLAVFRKRHPESGFWLVGKPGVSRANFTSFPAQKWFPPSTSMQEDCDMGV